MKIDLGVGAVAELEVSHDPDEWARARATDEENEQ